MSHVGTFSKQDLAVQQAQMAIMKNNANMLQKTMEILLETADGSRTVSQSPNRGHHADISI